MISVDDVIGFLCWYCSKPLHAAVHSLFIGPARVLDWAHMSSVSEVDPAIVEADFQGTPTVVFSQDHPVDEPHTSGGVLNHYGGPNLQALDATCSFVEVCLIFVLFLLPFELSILDVDGLIG